MGAIAEATALTGDPGRGCDGFSNEQLADYRHETAAELVREGRRDVVRANLDDSCKGANECGTCSLIQKLFGSGVALVLLPVSLRQAASVEIVGKLVVPAAGLEPACPKRDEEF